MGSDKRALLEVLPDDMKNRAGHSVFAALPERCPIAVNKCIRRCYAMSFESILFTTSEERKRCEKGSEPPLFFVDLFLDQIIDAVTAGKKDYDLKPFFYTPLKDIDTIRYRQEIARDLETPTLMEDIKSFAQKMIVMRRYLALIETLYHPYHRKGWFLEAVVTYCEAVNALARDLARADLRSRGLASFRDDLTGYARSDGFMTLASETEALKSELATVRYCVIIKEGKVKVRKYEQEADFSGEVEKIFEKFKQGAVKDYRSELSIAAGMNHVEAAILERVARLFPDIFARLDAFWDKNQNFVDATLAAFDREIQFYVAYLEYLAGIKRSGLKCCYPEIISEHKNVYDYAAFDLALANKRLAEGKRVVCNDFYLENKERILIISGPNQGGKTTFARAFGQLHYLACLGCPVPGKKARLFLFDNLFTHFEKEETIQNLHGKLQDDLVRMNHILDRATTDSIVIMNEIFTSTTIKDALYLSQKIMEKIIDLDLLGVWVTFLDELASMSEKTVSMMSTVVAENPARRTYKIVRKPADGLAYAMAIAAKHGLTYERLKERIEP
jgi:DNA mismatch repair protein MutS